MMNIGVEITKDERKLLDYINIILYKFIIQNHYIIFSGLQAPKKTNDRKIFGGIPNLGDRKFRGC